MVPFKNFFKLIRSNNLIIAFVVILETAFLLEVPFSSQLVLCILIILSFMAFGYIMNDIIDYETDIINHKKRPLCKGVLSEKFCYFSAFIFLFIGLFSLIFVNLDSQKVVLYCLMPLLFSYNFLFKRTPLIGNIIVAFLLSMVFILTELILKNEYIFSLQLSYLTFGLTFIREVLKDIADFIGDKALRMKTLPIVIGTKQAIKFVAVCILIYIGYTFYYLSPFLEYYKIYFITFIILIEIPLFYSLFLLIRKPGENTILTLVGLYKMIICSGLIVFILLKGKF